MSTKTDSSQLAALSTPDATAPAHLSDSDLADQIYLTGAKVDLFKPIKERHEALNKEARGRFDAAPANQKFELRGTLAVIQIGMKKEERFITSIFQLYKRSKLKIQDFLGKCKISLSEAETLPGADKLIRSERTGTRDLKAVPLVGDSQKVA